MGRLALRQAVGGVRVTVIDIGSNVWSTGFSNRYDIIAKIVELGSTEHKARGEGVKFSTPLLHRPASKKFPGGDFRRALLTLPRERG